ncbi:polysaccharide deacetylase family protein [Alkalilimnicola sp. S0819]|uniref:polysaccharide deacetylase family protein n=1 Tax=Alkalilimnicola sp. S0819 TaxID=2613922 RepID=UPI001261C9C4|nr:polysaccharide deacetylase family protein [Alkalilimnicola sp. S0819]KAB7628165.1 polysaccharide deacetylase family protein [Alkalilimnicola sp. S0819]MPQ15052.1 polysaccharide deacetylase family protein [Alkalilimnicola sp. S0819]
MRGLLFLVTLLLCAGQAGAAVVLMYHRFGEDELPATNIRLAQFEQQLEYIASAGYRVWPLARIAEHLREGRELPDRVLAITVDDAYASVYHEAFPRLRSRGWPFTVFVSTDPVDQGLRGYMSWPQLRELHEAGVALANHSASHAHLVRRLAGESEPDWRARVQADIQRAERRLREELGPRVNGARLFAYPYGDYDRPLAEWLAARGYLAFGQHSGALGLRSDPRALPRYPIAEAYADPDEFALKLASRPLPLRAVHPWNPLLGEAGEAPVLELRLDAPVSGLSCYYRGERLRLQGAEGRRVRVMGPARLPPGRSRYNCTAPAGEGRWYWYSHPWLVPGGWD